MSRDVGAPMWQPVEDWVIKNNRAAAPAIDTIIVPNNEAELDFTLGSNFDLLVHETYHVYQYTQRPGLAGLMVWEEAGSGYAYTLGNYTRSRNGHLDYGPHVDDMWNYRVEQQAAMMQDLYLLESGSSAINSLDPNVTAQALRDQLFRPYTPRPQPPPPPPPSDYWDD